MNNYPKKIYEIVCGCLLLSVLPSAWAEVVTDGSLGSAQTFTGDMTIDESHGVVKDTNLFFSFETFNVQQSLGESVNFTGSAGVDNIISRVTGASASTIDGTVSSSIADVNLWFFNPNGVLIGENASLDIPGSVHISDGSGMVFDNGEVFDLTTSNANLPELSQPSGFDFTSGSFNSMGVIVDQASITINENQSFSLVARDNLRIDSSTITSSNNGAAAANIQLISAEGNDQVVVTDLEWAQLNVITAGRQISTRRESLDQEFLDEFFPVAYGGNVSITNSNISSMAEKDNGSLFVHGGELDISNSSFTFSAPDSVSDPTSTVAERGFMALRGQNLSFDNVSIDAPIVADGHGANLLLFANNNIDINQLTFNNQVAQNATGQGLYLLMSAGNDLTVIDSDFLTQSDGPGVASGFRLESYNSMDLGGVTFSTRVNPIVNSDGTGRGSTIELTTPKLNVGKDTTGRASEFYLGDSSSLSVRANDIVINSGTLFEASAGGNGFGTRILLTKNDFQMPGSIRLSDVEFRSAQVDGADLDLSILSNNIFLEGIRFNAFVDEERHSTIAIVGDTVSFGAFEDPTSGNKVNSSFEISTIGDNPASIFYTKANDLEIKEGTSIRANTYASGEGGWIFVEGTNVTIDSATIETSSNGSGIGGTIGINATNELRINDSVVSTNTTDEGRGGNIRLLGRTIEITGSDTLITASAAETSGENALAGSISIGGSGRAKPIFTRVEISKQGDFDVLTILDENGNQAFIATGGNGTTEINRNGQIIKVGGDGATIGSGSINQLTNEEIISVSEDNEALLYFGTELIRNKPQKLVSITYKDARTVDTATVNISDGVRIESNANGEGTAGDIEISASNSLKFTDSRLTTSSANSGGGNINLDAGGEINFENSTVTASASGLSLDAARSSIVSTQQRTYNLDGGNIEVNAFNVTVENSNILATANAGKGGNITIDSTLYSRDEASRIDASSQLGIDGTTTISAELGLEYTPPEALDLNFLKESVLVESNCAVQQLKDRSSLVVSNRKRNNSSDVTGFSFYRPSTEAANASINKPNYVACR